MYWPAEVDNMSVTPDKEHRPVAVTSPPSCPVRDRISVTTGATRGVQVTTTVAFGGIFDQKW